MNSEPDIRLVLASANAHKAREIREIVAILTSAPDSIRVELLDRPVEIPDIEETGATLLENARLKARAVLRATGMAAVADDTGLEVDALDGAPGVHSARYAGPGADNRANTEKLLSTLRRLETERGTVGRGARFRTVVVVAFPDGREVVAEGSVLGTIALVERGSRGFGYDGIFEPEGGEGRTFAELDDAGKHALSHRGRALAALLASLARGSRR